MTAGCTSAILSGLMAFTGATMLVLDWLTLIAHLCLCSGTGTLGYSSLMVLSGLRRVHESLAPGLQWL